VVLEGQRSTWSKGLYRCWCVKPTNPEKNQQWRLCRQIKKKKKKKILQLSELRWNLFFWKAIYLKTYREASSNPVLMGLKVCYNCSTIVSASFHITSSAHKYNDIWCHSTIYPSQPLSSPQHSIFLHYNVAICCTSFTPLLLQELLMACFVLFTRSLKDLHSHTRMCVCVCVCVCVRARVCVCVCVCVKNTPRN
jgi:hypothetical protein